MKPGTRLRSQVCSTEVIVVRPADVALECGGAPMAELGVESPESMSIDPAHTNGTVLGKRYGLDDGGLEVLVTKPGEGSLSVAGRELVVLQAKTLPSSD